MLGAEQPDQIGEIGRMQRQGQFAGEGGVAVLQRGGDGVQELGADPALFVAQFDLACGVLHGLTNRQI